MSVLCRATSLLRAKLVISPGVQHGFCPSVNSIYSNCHAASLSTQHQRTVTRHGDDRLLAGMVMGQQSTVLSRHSGYLQQRRNIFNWITRIQLEEEEKWELIYQFRFAPFYWTFVRVALLESVAALVDCGHFVLEYMQTYAAELWLPGWFYGSWLFLCLLSAGTHGAISQIKLERLPEKSDGHGGGTSSLKNKDKNLPANPDILDRTLKIVKMSPLGFNRPVFVKVRDLVPLSDSAAGNISKAPMVRLYTAAKPKSNMVLYLARGSAKKGTFRKALRPSDTLMDQLGAL